MTPVEGFVIGFVTALACAWVARGLTPRASDPHELRKRALQRHHERSARVHASALRETRPAGHAEADVLRSAGLREHP